MHAKCREPKELGKYIERFVEATLDYMVSSILFKFEPWLKSVQVDGGYIVMNDSGNMIQVTPLAAKM